MKPIDLFGIGLRSKASVDTAQERINVYYEVKPEGEKSRVVVHGHPGKTLFVDLGANPIRGWSNIVIDSQLYVIYGDKAGTLTSNGQFDFGPTSVMLTTSGKVSVARGEDYIMWVDGQYGYANQLVTIPSNFGRITDPDFPTAPRSCTWLAGYFVVADSGTGQAFYTDDPWSGWTALDFITAETDPDRLVAVKADNGELLLFGEQTIEPWGVSGGASAFEPIRGAARKYGLAAQYSLVEFQDTLAFLARNPSGQVQVARMRGYEVEIISSPELETLINGYSTVLDASALTYQLGGHSFYQINFTSANKSWVFDAQSGVWAELRRGTSDRDRAELGIVFQERAYCADYRDGKIYKWDTSVYTDAGDPIIREIVGRHINSGFEEMSVGEFYLDFDTGVGLSSGQGSDPQVMLQMSKDNGRTWGNELWRSFGKIGKYLTRVIWRRLGTSRDWLFRVKISDPVKVTITTAAMQ